MITQKLQQSVAQAAKAAFNVDIQPQITATEPEFGDFATNVAFQLAGKLGRPPREIAAELAAAIDDALVAKAEAAGAGYVNLIVNDSYWLKEFARIGRGYGHSDAGRGTKVQVEFISANPTGPTTIGNARGGFIGDTLSRVLESQGYEVTREYYFNNAGTQISKLLESVKVSAGLLNVPDNEVQYRGEYINDLAAKFSEDLKSKGDDELKQLITQEILEAYIRPAIAKMNIHFDVWFNEDDVIKDGTFDEVLQRLRDKGLVYDKDGAVWLDSTKLGIKREDRVLVKRNGDPTYLAPDIAYHANIFGQRQFDWAIKVLGADHIDQFPSVQATVAALFPGKKLSMAGHQWFRLIKDGKEVKVSKRLGQFVTIEELIDEVGGDVARFMTLSRDENSHMDFDLDLAKEQSQKNPLYYVMYAYARAHSILAKAGNAGLKPGTEIKELNPGERQLVKKMAEFPALLEEIVDSFAVHKLTFFGRELAELFHDYYESERIIDMEPVVATEKLYFVQRFAEFMDNYFEILGVEPRAKM